MSEGQTPVLEIAGLSIALPGGGDRAFAVDDVSLSVGAGEIVCVVGESGSGKSVTAFSVLGLLARALKPVAGAIRLEGEDVLAATPQRLRALRGDRMAMIFQEPMTALNPVLTIGDQIDPANHLVHIVLGEHRGRPGAHPGQEHTHARSDRFEPAGLAEPVVARDEVEARRQVHAHRWRRADVLQVEVREHGAPVQRTLLSWPAGVQASAARSAEGGTTKVASSTSAASAAVASNALARAEGVAATCWCDP